MTSTDLDNLVAEATIPELVALTKRIHGELGRRREEADLALESIAITPKRRRTNGHVADEVEV